MATHPNATQIQGFSRCLGTAENYLGSVPVYSGIELSRLVRQGGLDPWLVDSSAVLKFYPCDLEAYRRLNLPAWDGLDYAVLGVGRWCGKSTLVYSKAAALQLLDESVTDIPDDPGGLLAGQIVATIYADQILPACLGAQTPFFFSARTDNQPE